jgi:hypothetical protein
LHLNTGFVLYRLSVEAENLKHQVVLVILDVLHRISRMILSKIRHEFFIWF